MTGTGTEQFIVSAFGSGLGCGYEVGGTLGAGVNVENGAGNGAGPGVHFYLEEGCGEGTLGRVRRGLGGGIAAAVFELAGISTRLLVLRRS